MRVIVGTLKQCKVGCSHAASFCRACKNQHYRDASSPDTYIISQRSIRLVWSGELNQSFCTASSPSCFNSGWASAPHRLAKGYRIKKYIYILKATAVVPPGPQDCGLWKRHSLPLYFSDEMAIGEQEQAVMKWTFICSDEQTRNKWGLPLLQQCNPAPIRFYSIVLC